MTSSTPPPNPTAYRTTPAGGPPIRTDIIEIYILKTNTHNQHLNQPHFLQLKRAADPLAQTWHPVMGHIEPNESSLQTAARELREEVNLDLTDPATAQTCTLWALQRITPYYVAAIDHIVISPRFCCQVPHDWQPTLNNEHTDHRWIAADDIERQTLWPNQIDAYNEIRNYIIPRHAPAANHLRIPLPINTQNKTPSTNRTSR